MAHHPFLTPTSHPGHFVMTQAASMYKLRATILIAVCAQLTVASGLLHAQVTLPAGVPGSVSVTAPLAVPLPAPAPAPANAVAPTITATGSGSATQSRPGGPVSLNFAAAEIEAVARTIAVISNRNVVVDPRVKGMMSLVTTSPVTPTQALRLFSLQLRTQGFALVESQGCTWWCPRPTPSCKAVPCQRGR